MNFEHQKCLLIRDYALPLKDFPENAVPKAGDKCLFVRDKNFCIPVYNKEVSRFPEEGLIFYASLSEERDSAEIGGTITKYGSTEYSAINGVPCVNFHHPNRHNIIFCFHVGLSP